jgi:hypothetical protein
MSTRVNKTNGSQRYRYRAIHIIQLNSYLFACKLNCSEANYRVSRSKKERSNNKIIKQNKDLRVFIVITIIIILIITPLKTKLLVRVKKCEVSLHDLQLLRRYALKDIYKHIFCYLYTYIYIQVCN